MMNNKGKILALDYGRQRTGVAISDTNCTLAFAREYIITDNTLIKDIITLCKEENIIHIIIGFPLHKDGQESDLIQEIKKIKQKLLKNGYSSEVYDERFTTKLAQNSFLSTGVHNKITKEYIDSESARILLQEYLYKKNNT